MPPTAKPRRGVQAAEDVRTENGDASGGGTQAVDAPALAGRWRGRARANGGEWGLARTCMHTVGTGGSAGGLDGPGRRGWGADWRASPKARSRTGGLGSALCHTPPTACVLFGAGRSVPLL